MKKLIHYALNQPLFIVLGTLLFALAGFTAFKNLSVEAFPDVTDTQVTVIALYPGRAAEEVEKQVTIPLEIALAGVPNSIRMFSHTQFGLSFIVVTFDEKPSLFMARQLVEERLRGLGRLDHALVEVLGHGDRVEAPAVGHVAEQRAAAATTREGAQPGGIDRGGDAVPAEHRLLDRAQLLSLTAPEMTVLVGGLRALGATVQMVTGNLKFDAEPDAAQAAQGQAWRAALHKPVCLLASSREGEEAQWLQAVAAQPSDAHWLIVPRHPQRVDEVEALLRGAGLRVSRRSQWGDVGPTAHTEASVWLGDSLDRKSVV